MTIEKLYIVNREDYEVTDVHNIDTDKTTIDDFADMVCDIMRKKWGHPTFVSGIDGDWNDDIIDIYMGDYDPCDGRDWYATVDMDRMDITLERR